MRRLAVALAALAANAAAEERFAFLPAPQTNLSLLYRLDRLTGDVIACQFAHNPGRADVAPGGFGIASCYRGGDGATNQPPGDYDLIASRNAQEGGVFRVERRSGAISICYLYVQREKPGEPYVVCTTPFK